MKNKKQKHHLPKTSEKTAELVRETREFIDTVTGFLSNAAECFHYYKPEQFPGKSHFSSPEKSEKISETDQNSEIDDLLALMKNIKNRIGIYPEIKNLKDNLSREIRIDTINEMLLHLQYSSEITCKFISSIITRTNKVSEPLSGSIFEIKKRLSGFLSNIQEWNNEFTKEGSEKNFNSIIKTYNSQNHEFTDMVKGIDSSYKILEKNLQDLESDVKEINKITDIITDISERIGVLSINASIESARAGLYGKGFKVVSNEVKKLAGNTQKSVTDIAPFTQDATKLLFKTLEQFNKDKNYIIELLARQNEGFSVFYKLLDNYYSEITEMFEKTSNLINDIHVNIDRLVPVFQESNLTIQALENMISIMTHFRKRFHNDIEYIISSLSEEEKNLLMGNFLAETRKLITTEDELSVIEEIGSKFNIKKEEKEDPKKPGSIEFF